MSTDSFKCFNCPRECGADRNTQNGYCGVGNMPKLARASLHMWEEPCISGSRGSGTVFFTGCNLRCIYCQNYKISQEHFGRTVSVEDLGKIFMFLKQKGAHNINLVSPSHFIPQIRESLIATCGLDIPVIYNSNGYDSIEALKTLEGCINVYMPDIKYIDGEISKEYSGAKDYFKVASKAVMEMYRQVGAAEFDECGLIKKGLILRHLILPGLSGESIRILDWIKNNMPHDIVVSVMSQYIPYYKAVGHAKIGRVITRWEYERVVRHLMKLNFKYGYIQERDSASSDYIPDFNLEGLDCCLNNPL